MKGQYGQGHDGSRFWRPHASSIYWNLWAKTNISASVPQVLFLSMPVVFTYSDMDEQFESTNGHAKSKPSISLICLTISDLTLR